MPAQPIKYASTTVDPSKSAGEIMELVRRYGGTRFESRWTNGILTGVRFAIAAEGIGEVPVRLDAQVDRIVEILVKAKRKQPRFRYGAFSEGMMQPIREQAYRIAWRQLKDFVEQALLAVETGLFPIGAAFMAHMEVWDQAADETITMSEFLLRRGVSGDERGIRLLGSREQPIVRRLPPAGEA